MEVTPESLARFFEVVLPHMNELQRRVVAGAAAEMLGRGGKTAVATASGMSRNTVIKAEADTRAEAFSDVDVNFKGEPGAVVVWLCSWSSRHRRSGMPAATN